MYAAHSLHVVDQLLIISGGLRMLRAVLLHPKAAPHHLQPEEHTSSVLFDEAAITLYCASDVHVDCLL
jgi:hypothetical protein